MVNKEKNHRREGKNVTPFDRLDAVGEKISVSGIIFQRLVQVVWDKKSTDSAGYRCDYSNKLKEELKMLKIYPFSDIAKAVPTLSKKI